MSNRRQKMQHGLPKNCGVQPYASTFCIDVQNPCHYPFELQFLLGLGIRQARTGKPAPVNGSLLNRGVPWFSPCVGLPEFGVLRYSGRKNYSHLNWFGLNRLAGVALFAFGVVAIGL